MVVDRVVDRVVDGWPHRFPKQVCERLSEDA
jgi:hypothetical protein